LPGLVAGLVLSACGTVPGRVGDIGPAAVSGSTVTIFVIKRSWHTDIGFAAADVHPPLASLRAALPGAHYLLFGFGDKHYLMNRGGSFTGMVGAVWPGDGLVLMTGLENTPEEAFGGASGVTRLTVTAVEAQTLEQFVWTTLATAGGAAHALGPGPYSGSVYYASSLRYSGVHTCNTWTAAALRTAGLPVRSFGVAFSGQVWRQVRHIKSRQEAPDGSRADDALPGNAPHP
jgi:hypothetical protein